MGCGGSKGADASGVGVSLTREEPNASHKLFPGAHSDDICNGVAASSTPGQWLSCAEDKLVALTDWRAGTVLHRWRGHERGVNRVVAVPHIEGALSASRDTTVRLWKPGSQEAAATLRGHELGVSSIALSEDGAQVLSGSRDSSLVLWDLASARETSQCHVSRNVVTCLKWIPGEAHLVAQGSEDLKLRVWDVRTMSAPALSLEGYVYFPLCCDASGPYVLTGSNGFDKVGCELRLWDRRSQKQVHEMGGHEQAVTGVALLGSGGGGGAADAAAAAGDGAHGTTLTAVSGCKDGTLATWDALSGTQLATMKLADGVTSVAAALAADRGASATPPAAGAYVGTTSGRVHAVDVRRSTSLSVVATGEVKE